MYYPKLIYLKSLKVGTISRTTVAYIKRSILTYIKTLKNTLRLKKIENWILTFHLVIVSYFG